VRPLADSEVFTVDPGYVGPWVNSKDIVFTSSCKLPWEQLPLGLPVPPPHLTWKHFSIPGELLHCFLGHSTVFKGPLLCPS
jgi:hypothetical protein